MSSLQQQQQQQTRIPKFGSRIPLPGQSPAKLPKLEESAVVTSQDVGRRVRVNDREGTLRYVGHVQFASGTWCGIEVIPGSGKNDGSVRGVRYFTCPKTCGLMAPLCKVVLSTDKYIDDNQISSGPYSMIFGLDSEKTATFLRSKTYDKIEYSPPKNEHNETFVKEAEENSLNQTVVYDGTESSPKKSDDLDKTFVLDNSSTITNATFCNKRNFVLENLITNNDKFNRTLTAALDEENSTNSKRDSLELEESLGILTPNQMIDVADLMGPLTPSSQNVALLQQLDNENTSSLRESLGIIDLSAMNVHLNRLDQTPSPEELPLDPIPIMEPHPEENKQQQPQNSIITSITSTTSLDTGYQGDGELSRPESRGADQLSLPRRLQPRPCSRRTDPMTDSDFYTESDADNHDEHPLRGDRRAQVIDGTLYGVDAQATADLYANNRENMDSSGIFTDIERTDDIIPIDTNEARVVELSPSDSSTKTISEDSQGNVKLILNKPTLNVENPNSDEVLSNSSTVISNTTPSNRSSSSREGSEKKYKMPKRNVTSKVKSFIEPNNKENNERRVSSIKKNSAGRWDAVMNKISKTSDTRNFKEVKSKVFTSLTPNVQRNNTENKKQQQQQQLKTPLSTRRVRSRLVSTPKKTPGSINTSSSDLSNASPGKQAGSIDKKRDVFRVSLNSQKTPVNNNIKGRNNVKNANNEVANNKLSRRTIFSSIQEKKCPTPKDIGKTTGKGGRVSPSTRSSLLIINKQNQPPPLPAPPTAEALAVLIQHLVFNLDAFNTPSLKKEIQKARMDAEEMRMSYKELEESFNDEKVRHSHIIEDERNKYRAEIMQLIEKHRNELLQAKEMANVHLEEELRNLTQTHREQSRNLKTEFEKLQQTLQESVDILREENDATRSEIDEKNDKIRALEAYKIECDKLRRDNEAKDFKLAELMQENSRIREESCTKTKGGDSSVQEVQSLRAVLELKQAEFAEMRKSLAHAQQKADLLPAAEERIAVLNAKCEDLLHQLDRKRDTETQLIVENKKLNESFKETFNREKRLSQVNEELMWKLQQNKELVSKVLEEAEASAFSRFTTISASFNERHHNSSSLSKRASFERTLSLRDRSQCSGSSKSTNGRKFRDDDESTDDVSPPTSPKVKGVVEKSDSLSYVLEMDESPEVAASRIVRRSFRNPTPPKNNTPTKSPANKRARKTNPLALSASETTIGSAEMTSKTTRSIQTARPAEDDEDFLQWHVMSASTPGKFRNACWTTASEDGDFDADDVEINIPALPSEIGRKDVNTLPVPKHFAGEAMISESNSEEDDESVTGSSSSGQL